jgi:PAS domain S-box-containing protein
VSSRRIHQRVPEGEPAEQALREKAVLLDNILRSSAEVAIATTDLDFRITYYNPLAEKFFGYTAAEVVGKTVMEMCTRENVEPTRFEQAIKQVRTSGEFCYSVARETDQGTRHMESRVAGIFDPQGELVGYSLFTRDVTERKRAEEALRQSEEKYRGIFDESVAAIYVFDCDKKFVDANRSGLELLGYSKEELLEMRIPEVDADPQAVLPAHEQLLAGERIVNYEHRLKHKDGRVITVLNNSRPLTDARGKVIGMQSTLIDITERKRAEQALRFTQFAVDHAADAAFWLEPNGRFFYVNEAACRSLGYSREELLGMTVHDIDPDFSPEVWPYHWEKLRVLRSFVLESHHRRKDGRVFPVEIVVNYLEFDGREYNCAFARDITARKQAEQELARYRDHLEELVKTRTVELEASQEKLRTAERLASMGTLAAGIAHEINNPVGSLMLAAQNGIKALDLPDRLPFARRCFEDVIREGKRCSEIVQSVLAFARQNSAEQCPLNINETVEGALEAARPYAEEHGVQIHRRLASSLPQVIGQALVLQRAFINLIHNAVEACQRGGKVTVATTASPGGVKVVVEDDGRGLTKEQRKRIFDPFYTTRLSRGGTGLGLSLAYGIITSHGGAIQVDSEAGRGTKIHVEFPRNRAAREE